jgi:hypothetical protein
MQCDDCKKDKPDTHERSTTQIAAHTTAQQIAMKILEGIG